MEKKIKYYEKFLYEIWKEQKFDTELLTNEGEKISIIDTGHQNKELGGPDFLNARIKIGNITYCGDVEIDSFYTDWKNHGHNINRKYNKVILHTSLNHDSNNSFVYTQEGRKVQSIPLDKFLVSDLRENIQSAIIKERKDRINKMPCVEVNDLFDKEKKLDFLFDLGIARFKKKCARNVERLKELKYLKELNLKEPVVRYSLDENFYNKIYTSDDFKDADLWKQLFYEQVFEALGYSKNKKEFLQLSHYADYSFIKRAVKDEDALKVIEAALFNIAGVIPEPGIIKDEETLEYIKSLRELWTKIKQQYDSETMNIDDWNFYKQRPPNFPTLRIAGGVVILFRMLKENLVSSIIKDFRDYNNKNIVKSLRSKLIVKGDGYWKKYYNFGQRVKQETKYFIGLSRADEIIINIILPYVSVYFDLFGEKEITKEILKIYINYFQNSENNLVQEVSSTLVLDSAEKRSILYQGMIELFRSYCSKSKCMECTIGKNVFN
ncbi:MAG TPA: DUF2851 family protein [Ignavibacteriaceae bacterium]|nr:DUF2851 family protein [Ignavibacteriaceae bacterium]